MNNEDFYTRTFYTTIMITAIILSVLLFLYTAKLFFLLLLAILIGIPLRNGGKWIASQTHITTHWGVLLVAALFVFILTLIIWLLGPRLATRTDEFITVVNQSIQQIEQRLEESALGERWLTRLQQQGELNILRMLPDPMQAVSNIFTSIISPFFTTIILYILGIMFAISPGAYQSVIVRALPDRMRSTAEQTFEKLNKALGWWLLARVTSIVVIGILTYIGLLILGTPIPLTLAVIAGGLSFIPNIGPLLSLIPAVLVGLSVSWKMVLYIILLYIALQTIESYLVTPYVEKRSVSLLPALTISVQSILTLFVGVIGAMVAAPLLVVVMILIETLYYPYILKKDESAIDYHIG